jgi:hypothetical protein
MAIRNDFAPGEVLAAADLNDTFGSKVDYPSGGADGDALIKSGTAASWGAAGGLTLITSESFSAVSSVSVNGCFTSTYENYLIVCDGVIPSGDDIGLRFRLRASGSDNTTTNYAYVESYAGTSASNRLSQNDTSWLLGNIDNGAGSPCRINLGRPEIAAQTVFSTSTFNLQAAATFQSWSNGAFLATTQFDGFSLFPASGTISGTLRVYGYRN